MAGVFAQDDWEVRRGLTLNVGVRWDRDSLFQGDNNNFAPRAGFAWNVGGDAQDGHPRQHRDLLRHARVVGDQPRVEHRPGRADDDRSAAGRSAVPDVPQPVERVPERADDGRARDGVRAGLRRRRLPGQHRRPVPAERRRTSSTPTSASSTSSARLGGVGRLRARLRLRPAGDVGHQRAAVLRARARADADGRAGERAAAARRPEPHRRRLRHPVHRLPQPLPAVQRRAHRIPRAEARGAPSGSSNRYAAQAELHLRPCARRRRQLPV